VARYIKPPKQRLSPIKSVRGQRLFALFFGYMIGSAALCFVFFPLLMAATDTDLGLRAGLAQLYRASPFVVVLPGVIVSVLYLGPVWLVLRYWLARQADTDIGARPAVLPVWITVWFLFTAVQIIVAGDGEPVPPPAPFSAIPDPLSQLFNGIILVKMAGVTVMFAVYRRIRAGQGKASQSSASASSGRK
jgi:hypothetical protein